MKRTTGSLAAVMLIFVTASAEPDLVEVEPAHGWVDQDTEITLSGSGFDLEAEVLLKASGPFIVGECDTPGPALDVAVAGDYAYVADGNGGLRIIDISNPQAPALAGHADTPGYAYGVALDRHYAYVADGGSGLQVIDVSNPHYPELVGSYDTPDGAHDVAVVGNYVVIADVMSGLQIVDVNDASSPRFAATFDTPGEAFAVAIVREHAFVADGTGGLRVIDLSDPRDPRLAAHHDMSGIAIRVVVAGDYAYVADNHGGLTVFDVSDPHDPTFAAVSDLGVLVAVARNYAYVATPYGLHIIDISDPRNPTFASAVPLDCNGVVAAAQYAYCANLGNGLQVIDVTSPYTPRLGWSCDVPSHAWDISVAGGYAYVASESDRLRVIDIGIPDTPTPVGSCRTAGSTRKLAVAGDYAYVVGQKWNYVGYLQIIDVSIPHRPRPVGVYWIWPPRYPHDVVVAGSYAYVADRHGVQIIDVGDPRAPVFVGNYDTYVDGVWSEAVAVAGDYVFVGGFEYRSGSGVVLAIEISSPENPTLAGAYRSRWPGGRSVVAASDHVYFLGTSYLQIIDVSDPHAPTLIASHLAGCPARDLAVVGDYAYTAAGDKGLRVIDISDPFDPVLALEYDTPGDALGVSVAGDHAYVADGQAGMRIIRPNPPLLNIACVPDSTIRATVPPGFSPGPYDVVVTSPVGASTSLRSGFSSCERHLLTCDLRSLDGGPSSQSWPGSSTTSWRLTLDGDGLFFTEYPRHEAHLLLPDLPSTMETVFRPGDGSGRMVVRLELLPEADSGVVRLVGDDQAALLQLWDQMRASGDVKLPRLDRHAYGDLGLTVMPTLPVPIGEPAVIGPRYSYEVLDGRLTAALASGPGADLTVEVVAWDQHRCKTVERISFLEATGALMD